MTSKKTNWDEILGDITNQFITIQEADYEESRTVFNGVFDQIGAKMASLSPYFNRHCKEKLYAGSVYDRIKISKLDEYDMDVVVSLPVDYKDITVENDEPGFVTLNVGKAFDYLDTHKDWTTHYKVTRDWRDTENYILQNKFRSWLHGVLDKTLNAFGNRITVNNVQYMLQRKQSGPAFTLNIRNELRGFELDVDFVAVIKFHRPRWPQGYRQMENSKIKEWLVVPKPKKSDINVTNETPYRSWRLSFLEFERELMKGLDQLKPTVRLLKKLRDSLQMKLIASYYIKTLFLWKIEEKSMEFKYWQQGLGILFYDMVNDFYSAMKTRKIKYFWHEEHNLISRVDPSSLDLYAGQLKVVLDGLRNNNVDKVVNSLLTEPEQEKYKETALNKNKSLVPSNKPVSLKGRGRHDPTPSTSKSQQNPIHSTSSELDKASSNKNKSDGVASDLAEIQNYLELKIKNITDKISNDRRINEININNPNKEWEKGGRADLLEVMSVLNSWLSKIVALTDQDEMRELLNKIDIIADKTNEQCEMLKRKETSDSEYVQRYDELYDTVLKLMIDNDALKADIQEAEKRGERKGTLKTLLYSAFVFIVGFSGGGRNVSNDNILNVNYHQPHIYQPAHYSMVHHRYDEPKFSPEFNYQAKYQKNVTAQRDDNKNKDRKTQKDEDAGNE